MEASVFTFLEDSGFDGVALLLLFASLATFGFWALVLGVLWAASFPRLPSPGPETTDLGPEPPAISNLLVHRFKVTRAAMPATLLDLAARGLLEIQMLSRDDFVIRVKTRSNEGEDLLPYEQQIFAWVKSQATGGSAPLQALSVGSPAQAAGFWERFEKSVVSDARKRGLVRSRWAKRDWVILGTILAAAMGLLALSFSVAGVGDSGEDPMNAGDWLLFAFFGWVGVLAVITRFQDLRDTKKGQEVASRWLGVREALKKSTAFNDAPPSHVTIWERNLSHAVAMGLAHESVRQLPFEEENPETAWTRQTGVWREIDISYPIRFGFSERPLWVLWGGIWRVAVWGGLAFFVVPVTGRILWDVVQEFRTSNADQLNQISPLAINGLIALIVAFVGGWTAFLLVRFAAGLIRLWRSLSDLGKPPLVVEGEVVKLHMGRIAVDDGKVEETKGWMPPPTAPALVRGMKIRYSRTPNLWHVTNVEVLKLPGGVEPRAANSTRVSGAAGSPVFNLPAMNAATGLSLAAAHPGGDSGMDDEMAGVAGPFGRAVATGAFSDGRVDVHVVKLDPAALGGFAGNMMAYMTSKAQQRMARFEGAGDSGFWMGEDTLIVTADETRYVVRVTGSEDLVRRQRIAEQVARVVVEGAPAAASSAASAPGGIPVIPGTPAGPLGNPIFAAAAAIASAAAKHTGTQPPTSTPVEPAEAAIPAPAAEPGFPGWTNPAGDGDASAETDMAMAADVSLEAFEPPSTESVVDPEVLYTPPPVFVPELEVPDVDAVATADGRVIVPAEVRAPARGFPRPGRRFGPDNDEPGDSDERAAGPPPAAPIAPTVAIPEHLDRLTEGAAAVVLGQEMLASEAGASQDPLPAKPGPTELAAAEPRGFARPLQPALGGSDEIPPAREQPVTASHVTQAPANVSPVPKRSSRNPWKR